MAVGNGTMDAHVEKWKPQKQTTAETEAIKSVSKECKIYFGL